MSGSTLLRGTMLLTAATFLSKLLGMIYVIPFEALVGDTGGTLLSFAYIPYTIFISISTIGVPLAVSKFVSKYNALGDYYTGRRVFKAGMSLMAITGVLSFIIMYSSAGLLAEFSISDDAQGITKEDVTQVIQMISFALLIIPGMSIVRGFFQGYEYMEPTAFSQVVEQLVRIAFLLISVYVVMELGSGDIPTAVNFASFAAFIGAIASVAVLWFFWRKQKPMLDERIEQQQETVDISMQSLFKELLTYAGPFVLVGLATPLYQQIDSLTFSRAMAEAGNGEIAEKLFGIVNLYSHKLVIIPVTLATGLSLALLPTITKSFTEDRRQQLNNQLNQALQIIIVLIFPAVVGISVLSYEAYGTFFGVTIGDSGTVGIEQQGNLLRWYAPVAMFYALFTVTSSILQGLNKQRFAVISLGAGVLLKLILNIPFIHWFGAKGIILTTGIAASTAVALNLWKIRSAANFSYKQIYKRSLFIIILTILMTVIVLVVKWLLSLTGLSYENGRFQSLTVLLISAGVGGLFYLWVAYQTTLLERVLGNRVKVLDRFLKRK
ncbi:cell division protein [Pontibacillus chungwhensis BH030062]|uniref:Cell division protein n=1 Tax=Pontibacillus chungwhensis BH030062 TaxID=1385513 RepID=A0A0A2UQH9_9BACI|nr:polysaccharide biosynthesis protein [Pontibacillus chungwhensis]KGP90204.1 cell division protein [Pontibacillus chungwhensis BH030062]